MPPRTDELPTAECTNVFKDEESGQGAAKPILVTNGNPSAFISLRREENREVETNSRVRTKHRTTYELDRYVKNAMLVFYYDSYPGSKDTAVKVKNTFEKFRFEVEAHCNATGDQVRAICETFFQKDFEEYGAVAVIVVGMRNDEGAFITPGSCFAKSDIQNHFDKYSLRLKPKIFLTQSDDIWTGTGLVKTRALNQFEMHLLSHMGSADAGVIVCPLRILCDKVDEFADRNSFPTIAVSSFAISHESRDLIFDKVECRLPLLRGKRCFSPNIFWLPYHSDIPFSLLHSMQKSLYFWRK